MIRLVHRKEYYRIILPPFKTFKHISITAVLHWMLRRFLLQIFPSLVIPVTAWNISFPSSKILSISSVLPKNQRTKLYTPPLFSSFQSITREYSKHLLIMIQYSHLSRIVLALIPCTYLTFFLILLNLLTILNLYFKYLELIQWC